MLTLIRLGAGVQRLAVGKESSEFLTRMLAGACLEKGDWGPGSQASLRVKTKCTAVSTDHKRKRSKGQPSRASAVTDHAVV